MHANLSPSGLDNNPFENTKKNDFFFKEYLCFVFGSLYLLHQLVFFTLTNYFKRSKTLVEVIISIVKDIFWVISNSIFVFISLLKINEDFSAAVELVRQTNFDE
jgi:hypothetical protein